MNERNQDSLPNHDLLTATQMRNGLLAGVAIVGALIAGTVEAEQTKAAQGPAKVKPSHQHPAMGVGNAHPVHQSVAGVGPAHIAK